MSSPQRVSSHRRFVARASAGLALCAVVALSALPARAFAAGPADTTTPVLETGIHDTVHAGDQIDLKWFGVDASVEELEIQLSLDGGRHFTLRVSPELEARDGHFLWRVPNLASADARLRMRFNRGGREIEGGSSAAFRITPNVDGAPEYAQIHEGAWWMGASDPEVEPGSSSLASPGPAVSMASAAGVPGVQARGMSVPRFAATPAVHHMTALSAPPGAALRETPAPRVIAKRN